MKIAVTGSEGFLGRLIVDALRSRGHEVAECTKGNCDVLNPMQVKKALRGVQAVVHCAAKLDEDGPSTYEVNVKGTENVLEACAQNSINQFIFLSTAGIYGPADGEKSEESEPAPQTIYEKSKLEAERRVLSYQEVFCVTILRPALVLGSNKYWSDIIKTVRKGFPLIGEGNYTWQIACAGDVADAAAFLAGKEESFCETFNVAEKDPMTLREIVELIRKESGMEGRVRTIPVWLGSIIAQVNSLLNFDPILKPAYLKRMLRERKYSIKKLEALGWKPKCSARGEIAKIVKRQSAK